MEHFIQPYSDYFTLVLIALLLIKHFIADFVLQSQYILENRHKYGHPGGLLHAAIHAIATLLVLVWVSVETSFALIAAILEGVVHYHIDWLKEQFSRRHSLNFQKRLFWVGLGFDQLLHHMTYIVLTMAVLRYI